MKNNKNNYRFIFYSAICFVFLLIFYQYGFSYPKKTSKTVNGIKFSLEIKPGSGYKKTQAIVTFTNKSKKELVVPKPFVMPGTGGLGGENTIQIKNSDDKILEMTGIHSDFISRPVVSLAAFPASSNSETWTFELENCFPELTKPGKYKIEFKLISNSSEFNNAAWEGTVDLFVTINKGRTS